MFAQTPAKIRLADVSLPPGIKWTSVLRRVPAEIVMMLHEASGHEGDVCAFQLPKDAAPIMVEAVCGRALTIAPGGTFLGTPAHRESTRWSVGYVPEGGLIPGHDYWTLAACGAVGELIDAGPRGMSHLARVRFLGVVRDGSGTSLTIDQFALRVPEPLTDWGAPVFLVVGTSSQVGKTTAAVNVLRSLLRTGYTRVLGLKATGTSSLTELHSFYDAGAEQCFDCLDFGLPTTHPSGRAHVDATFAAMLDVCLSTPADAVVIECGGDIIGASVPAFLACLQIRRPDAKVVLVAPDALAALGAKTVLGQMGWSITLITGPCTDTLSIQQRTESLCGLPALNLVRGNLPFG
jgi:hypothetical protein